jgi:hypothetical protein
MLTYFAGALPTASIFNTYVAAVVAEFLGANMARCPEEPVREPEHSANRIDDRDDRQR